MTQTQQTIYKNRTGHATPLLLKLNQNRDWESFQSSLCASSVSRDWDKWCTYAIAGVKPYRTTLGCGLHAAFIRPQWPTLNTGYPKLLLGRAYQSKREEKHKITPDLNDATDKVWKTWWDTDAPFVYGFDI